MLTSAKKRRGRLQVKLQSTKRSQKKKKKKREQGGGFTEGPGKRVPLCGKGGKKGIEALLADTGGKKEERGGERRCRLLCVSPKAEKSLYHSSGRRPRLAPIPTQRPIV